MSEPRWQTREGTEEAARRVLNQPAANQQSPISRNWLATFVDNAIARWAASSNLASKKDVENAIQAYEKSHPNSAVTPPTAPTTASPTTTDDNHWPITLAWLVILTALVAVCFGKIRKLGSRTLVRYEKMRKSDSIQGEVEVTLTNPWPFALKVPLVDAIQSYENVTKAYLIRDGIYESLAGGDIAMIFSRGGIPIWIKEKSTTRFIYSVDISNPEPEPTTNPNPADEVESHPLPPLFPESTEDLPDRETHRFFEDPPTGDEDNIDIPAFLRHRDELVVMPPPPAAPLAAPAVVIPAPPPRRSM
jgi:hypothetical protein